MPSGVYQRRLEPIENGANLRSDVSLLGATTMVEKLVQQIVTLVRLYPRVTETVPATAALMNGHLQQIEHSKRVNQPLKPAPTTAKGRKISDFMRQRWQRAKQTGTINPKTGKPMGANAARATAAGLDINPKTGQPYKFSAVARARMSAAQRRIMRNPIRKKQAIAALKKANAVRHGGKKKALSPAQLRQRQAAAAAMRARLAAKRQNGTPAKGFTTASRAKVGAATAKRWALARKLGMKTRQAPAMADLLALQAARANAETLTSTPTETNA